MIERSLGRKSELGSRLSEDPAGAAEQPSAASFVAEHGEEVARGLVVLVAILAQPRLVAPAALIDAKPLGENRGTLSLGRGETALDLSIPSSDVREHVHLGRLTSANRRPSTCTRETP